jgi:hypothetical protein
VDILEEAKRNKEMEEEKLTQIKELISRKNEYATNVKEKFRSVSKLESNKERVEDSKGNSQR